MRNKADKLNILRFTAFMMVFLLHSTAYMPEGWEQMPCSWLIYTPAWAGTWIFFILAGYGVGASLDSGKYDPLICKGKPLHSMGIIRFYIRRFAVITPLYWLWLLCVALFVQSDILRPGPTHIRMLLKLMLFDYHEEFCQDTFGVAWYITTLMRLYLIAPLIYAAGKRSIVTKKRRAIVFTATMILFLGIRVMMLYHYRISPPDMWSSDVYKPWWFNLDLFACGVLLNIVRDDRIREPILSEKGLRLAGILSFCGIIGVSVVSSYHYYLADRVLHSTTVFMDVYRYMFPSVYLVMCLVFIYCFDIRRSYAQTVLSISQTIKNPARIFDCFRSIQYPMYLFHPIVMYCLNEVYEEGMYDGSLRLLGCPVEDLIWAQGVFFVIYAFILAVILSVCLCFFANDNTGRF